MNTGSDISIVEVKPTQLQEYASISIAYEYDKILQVHTVDNGLGGFTMKEVMLSSFRRKNYDEHQGNTPLDWSLRFDISKWGILLAMHRSAPVGGAAIAFGDLNIRLLDDRNDIAVLWDIRIDPEFRKKGIGSRLLSYSEAWAKTQGAKLLKIETQNINLEACRFYSRKGYSLEAINRMAYEDLPDEVQLLWYKWL